MHKKIIIFDFTNNFLLLGRGIFEKFIKVQITELKTKIILYHKKNDIDYRWEKLKN